MEKKDEEKLEEALIKKAIGFNHDEVIEEYAIDEQGEVKLIKKKVTKKFSPPDIPAIKMLFENFNKEVPLEKLSDKELKKEKQRLLKELEKSKKEKKNGS